MWWQITCGYRWRISMCLHRFAIIINIHNIDDVRADIICDFVGHSRQSSELYKTSQLPIQVSSPNNSATANKQPVAAASRIRQFPGQQIRTAETTRKCSTTFGALSLWWWSACALSERPQITWSYSDNAAANCLGCYRRFAITILRPRRLRSERVSLCVRVKSWRLYDMDK